jgi:SAM-dependent methyltransferase
MDHHHVADTWQQGAPYERYIGRWSRRIAPLFLSWLEVPAGYRWLDVGCGTGALCAAILERCRPASVTGVEPSAGFLETAREALGERVAFHQGSALALPLASASVDVVVSGLVLNFVPDARAALVEMARVTVPGGRVGAYVWDYADKMEALRFFWDAAALLDPAAALDEGVRFPLASREGLAQLFTAAGLRDVETTAIEIATPFRDFDDYWKPFLGGQGSAPSYVALLDDVARVQLQAHLRDRLPIAADGSVQLSARAWAVRGSVPT